MTSCRDVAWFVERFGVENMSGTLAMSAKVCARCARIQRAKRVPKPRGGAMTFRHDSVLNVDALPRIVPKAEHQENAANHDVEHHCVPRTDNAQISAVNRPT